MTGNKKVKNAKKVDMNGNNITVPIPQWREQHPNEIYFDSYVEYYFWRLLLDNNIPFELKNIVKIVPTQEHLHWGFTKDEYAILRDAQKGNKTASEKAQTTRWFNSNYNKAINWKVEPKADWRPDFYLPFIKTYVDTKGHQKDKGWRFKYKVLLSILSPDYNIVLLQTQKDCREFIQYLKDKKYVGI